MYFLQTLAGEELNSRNDTICLNAAPILFMMGKAHSMDEGYARSVEIPKSGKVLKKFRQWVLAHNLDPAQSMAMFEALLQKAEVGT